MATFASVMKNEIRRLAKSEAKALLLPLKKDKLALKKAVRGLKKMLLAVEKKNQALAAEIKTLSGIQAQVAPTVETNVRITAKGIRSLRRKLRLSQAEFARLAEVSPITVLQWEKKNGALTLRGNKELILAGLRKLGARDARRRLDALSSAARKPRRKAR